MHPHALTTDLWQHIMTHVFTLLKLQNLDQNNIGKDCFFDNNARLQILIAFMVRSSYTMAEPYSNKEEDVKIAAFEIKLLNAIKGLEKLDGPYDK